MKVLIATKNLHTDSKIRGIGVYARELTQALNNKFPKSSFITDSLTNTSHDYDLIHYPFFDPFFLTLSIHKQIPTIATIHDLIPIKYPQHFPAGLRGKLKWLRQKKLAQQLKHIITDSQASKQDIIRLLNLPASRVGVVPLGPSGVKTSAQMARKAKELYNLPRRYLLYVGDINWNKNIVGLIQAFAKLQSPTTHLVLVGKSFTLPTPIPELKLIQQAILQSTKQDKIHLVGYIPSHHLPAFYRYATLYVQPSWDEGFGLPVLDAMVHGCPVVSSNRGSLPEVGGDAVAYFDPAKADDLTKVLTNLLSNSKKRNQLIHLGKEQAKKFSWQLTAQQTYEIYQQTISDNQ